MDVITPVPYVVRVWARVMLCWPLCNYKVVPAHGLFIVNVTVNVLATAGVYDPSVPTYSTV